MGIESFLSNQQLALKNSLGSSTDVDRPTLMSRYMGGHNRTNQPYITGYHQILVSLPTALFGSAEESGAVSWLRSTCEGFTPHSSNMNFVDINGVGQLGSSFPTSRVINREFTLTFREYRQLPILNIFRTWHCLFDTHMGISSFTASEFVPKNYKGCIVVGILKPTASGSNTLISEDDLEDVYMYEGVFPTICPEDTIAAADQATNDSIQASVTFKFDGAPFDKSNPDLVQYFIKGMSDVGGNYNSVYEILGTSL